MNNDLKKLYWKLCTIENKIDVLHRHLNIVILQEDINMSIGQDILDMVTEEDTLLDSCLSLLQGLVDTGTIPADTLTAIKAKIQGSEDKLNAAIAANTPPALP